MTGLALLVFRERQSLSAGVAIEAGIDQVVGQPGIRGVRPDLADGQFGRNAGRVFPQAINEIERRFGGVLGRREQPAEGGEARLPHDWFHIGETDKERRDPAGVAGAAGELAGEEPDIRHIVAEEGCECLGELFGRHGSPVRHLLMGTGRKRRVQTGVGRGGA